MKKSVLIVCMFCISVASYSQFEQGTILAGGSVNFSTITEKYKTGSTTVTNGNTTSFSFMPQGGYFVIDNLAVGAGINLAFSKYKPDNDQLSYLEYKTSTIQLSPFARYYLQKVFFQGQVGFGSAKSEDYEGDDDKFSVMSWSLGVGYAAFLSDDVAIEPSIVYGSQSRKLKDSDPVYKDIDGGLLLSVGLQVYLR
jgi:hypothetical protein